MEQSKIGGTMKKSIRARLVGNFMIVIIITVLILEFFLISAIRKYYYKNVEDIVTDQIEYSGELYSRYFSSSSLEDIITDDVDVFFQQTNAEVQILDLEGNILMDSIGVTETNIDEALDFQKALKGEKGAWIGNVDYDDSNVMAISYPLRSDGNIIGILRFITSMRETNKAIRHISYTLIFIGLIAVFIAGVVAVTLANSIIKPVEEVTKVAEKMADGDLNERSQKSYDDEIGKLSDTLNYMAEELIKKDQLKNDFISSVSHELRTPLTSIKGWAITLKSEDLGGNPVLKDGLKIIENESDRLSSMVEELLDFSKFASGRITLNKSCVDIKEVISYVGSQFKPRASERNIEFNIYFENKLSNIEMDENRIKQVLVNLLDNAMKFTQDGGKISLVAKQEKRFIVISIEDNGCGIPEEDLPYVKEKFYKGKSSKSKNGLGLSICDEIVALHEGLLGIQSKVDVGTIVYVYLPIKEEIKE